MEKLKMGFYVSDAGERKNPFSPEERKALGKLAENVPSMYVNGPMQPEFRQRLDEIGTKGVLRLIQYLHDLSRFDGLGSEAFRVVEENGGVEYLIQQLHSHDHEQIFRKFIGK